MNIFKKLTGLFISIHIVFGCLILSAFGVDSEIKHNLSDNKNSPKVILSLASYPPKYNALPYALKTLANQNVKPDKIILNLYLHENSEQDKQRINDILEEDNLKDVITINWIEERIKSYAKLIPTLKDYPNDIIITADDDWEYYPDFVGDLLKKHEQFPDCIISNVASRLYDDYRIRTNNTDKVFPKNKPINDGAYCFTGFGMLCPPHCFNDKVFDKDLFMEEFPTTDDIWFPFCAKINNTKIVRVFDYNEFSGIKAINALRKYQLENVPTLYSVNKDSGEDYNRKNLAKIKKMFEDMNIKVNYLKANNRNSYNKNARIKKSVSYKLNKVTKK